MIVTEREQKIVAKYAEFIGADRVVFFPSPWNEWVNVNFLSDCNEVIDETSVRMLVECYGL